MKFAICNELFEGWDFERVCRFVKAVGYDGLELAPYTLATPITELAASRRSELRICAADAGVQLIGLHWLLAKTRGLHLTSSDVAVRRATAAYLGALAEACRDLGGTLMVFGSPQQRSLAVGVSRAQAFDFAVDTFSQALPRVADAGVTLCMEPLTLDETDFVNTCAEGAALVKAVDHPAFMLHLDVKAMSSETTPVTTLIRRFAGHAGHFHANDPNRGGPGSGDADFVPIFLALADAGYSGWVSVEVFDVRPGPETIARQSLEYMKSCLPRKESLA
jgi:sugar phosphate isomerase/epimerase